MDTLFIAPYLRVSYESALAPDDVARRLRDILEPCGFAGTVSNGWFSVRDAESFYNAYDPRIRGSIVPAAGDGSQLSAVISLHPIGVLVLCVLAAVLCGVMIRSAGAAIAMLVVLGLLHLGLCVLGFAPVARRAAEMLRAAGKAG